MAEFSSGNSKTERKTNYYLLKLKAARRDSDPQLTEAQVVHLDDLFVRTQDSSSCMLCNIRQQKLNSYTEHELRYDVTQKSNWLRG